MAKPTILYDPNSACPACGNTDNNKSKYFEHTVVKKEDKDKTKIKESSIKRVCGRCEYTWYELCLFDNTGD